MCILDPWACYSKGGWGETQAFRMHKDGVPKRLWETQYICDQAEKGKRKERLKTSAQTVEENQMMVSNPGEERIVLVGVFLLAVSSLPQTALFLTEQEGQVFNKFAYLVDHV